MLSLQDEIGMHSLMEGNRGLSPHSVGKRRPIEHFSIFGVERSILKLTSYNIDMLNNFKKSLQRLGKKNIFAT